MTLRSYSPNWPARRGRASGAMLVILLAAQLLVVLDASIVNVALPSIGASFGVSQASLQWVVTGYLLPYGGLLLVTGRLADLLDARALLGGGLLLFATASAAGGLAPCFPVLVGTRVAQGIGAAVIAPTSLALINATLSGRQRARALGWWAAMGAFGFTAGAILGGILVQYLSWRAVLWVNVPLGVVAAAVSLRGRPANWVSWRAARSVRIFPAVQITAAAASVVYAASSATAGGWGSAPVLIATVAAAVLILLFIRTERRAQSPLVPRRLRRRRDVRAANLLAVAFGLTSTAGVFLLLTFYLQAVVGYSPLAAGVAFSPMGLLILLTAPAVGRLLHRFDAPPLLVVGLLLLASGLSVLGALPAAGSYWSDVLPGLLLLGLGYGPVLVAIVHGATAGAAEADGGLAAGLVNTSAQVGGALGAALYVSIAGTAVRHHAAEAHGYGTAFTIGAALLVASLALVAIELRRRAHGPRNPVEATASPRPRLSAHRRCRPAGPDQPPTWMR